MLHLKPQYDGVVLLPKAILYYTKTIYNDKLELRLDELADAFIISGFNKGSVNRTLSKIVSKSRVLSYNTRKPDDKVIVPWVMITYGPGARQTREFVQQGSKILNKSPFRGISELVLWFVHEDQPILETFCTNARLFLCLFLVRTKVLLRVGLKDVCPANWLTLSRQLLALLPVIVIALIVMQHVFLDVWFTWQNVQFVRSNMLVTQPNSCVTALLDTETTRSRHLNPI